MSRSTSASAFTRRSGSAWRALTAPEVRGKEREDGLRSLAWLAERVLNRDVIIETDKDKEGKYGRYIAKIHVQTPGGWLDVNRWIVDEGHAVEKEY